MAFINVPQCHPWIRLLAFEMIGRPGYQKRVVVQRTISVPKLVNPSLFAPDGHVPSDGVVRTCLVAAPVAVAFRGLCDVTSTDQGQTSNDMIYRKSDRREDSHDLPADGLDPNRPKMRCLGCPPDGTCLLDELPSEDTVNEQPTH